MCAKNMRDEIFGSELGSLMVVSYIVLGNNLVSNRYIDRTWQIPVQAWSALFAIERFPGIRAKEIVQLFPRPQNTVSRAIALLSQRGWVEQRPSPEDRRERQLFITAKGAEVLREMQRVSHARQEELFSPLTSDEREVFYKLARRVAEGPALLESRVMPSKG